MVVNNFDGEPIQICLCGHLGCGGDTVEEPCLLEVIVAKECGCTHCTCQDEEEEE